ncbi:hypothetical protein, partial [Planotetraspora phitsanulokensis]
DLDDVTPNTIEHRPTREETVLAIGNRRYPATLTDRASLLDALNVSDAIAHANHAWRASLVAALQKLDAEDFARETATT